MALFVTFEGGEGSGKSTQVRALHRRLKRRGIASILIHEPGSTPLGERVARLVKQSRGFSIAPVTELFLFNAARAELVTEVITPSLNKSLVVICDRFADSTVAYQGYGRSLDLKLVNALNRAATGGLKPDLTILIDVPVGDGLARKSRNDGDRFEHEALAFHERVRRGYLELALAEPRRFFVVDGRRDVRAVADAIWKKVSSRLKP
jgi:dTMP kinase